jgi:large subunit ribosomal protein L9
MMKIILQEDVNNLGVVGDLVTVRDGYGRNYLIPQGKAVFASVRSIAELEHQKRLAAHKRQLATAEAQAAKAVIQKLSITMQAKVAPPQIGEDGKPIVEKLQKLFGTITNRDIAKVLGDFKVKVDHRRLTLKEPVRTVGKYFARIRLDGGVETDLPFWVIPEGAADVEAEKKRVEAAQESFRKEQAEAAAAAAAAAVALALQAETEAKARAEARKKAEEDEAASLEARMADDGL